MKYLATITPAAGQPMTMLLSGFATIEAATQHAALFSGPEDILTVEAA